MLSSGDRVLIVTGSLLSASEPSLLAALKKQLLAVRASSGAWLDLQLKIAAGEHLLAAERRRRSMKGTSYEEAVQRFFAAEPTGDVPELTEVLLMTLLAREGVPFEVATYAELYADPARRDVLLDACSLVFASTTLLRDLSEMQPMTAMLKRPGNRVVAGGALAAIVHHDWPGMASVDVLAVGYGESLVPALVRWQRSGFVKLEAPEGGRLLEKSGTPVLFGALPPGKDLDALPAADWSLAARHHDKRFRLVHYESVRGCPYRCSFCNYPYLFDDTKFRYRSAARITEDWAALEAQGVQYISCLDSLFTMPKRRLRELCELLIARGSTVKWICYARADDLAERDTVELMKAAGCHQVQIGVESGSQEILDNMNKRVTVETNAAALVNCREVGLTTLVTVIVGYPGETAETVRQTFELLKSAPPDVFYVAPFNTRVEYVPILSEASRERFGIVTAQGTRTSAPYWRHATMACTEVAQHAQWLVRSMMEQRVALEGTVFYRGLLDYDARDRQALLDFQRDVATRHPFVRAVVKRLMRWADRRLERDVRRVLGAPSPGRAGRASASPASGRGEEAA